MSVVPTIAVVDDDQAIREAMDDLVKSCGFQCKLFSSAEEFLEYGPRSEIDCMLVDVKMPGLSGIELQDVLNQEGHRPPMIFVTSYKDDRTKAAAMNGGAIVVLGKPVDVGVLIDHLEAAVRR